MKNVTLQEAQTRLAELIRELQDGEVVVITENDVPVAKLTKSAPKQVPRLGTLKGTVLYMAPDFDAPLEDFEEYS